MNNDDFNMSMRKFLKQVGVTSQQEIEKSVRSALEAGTVDGGELSVKMVLTIAETGLSHTVEGKIALGSGT